MNDPRLHPGELKLDARVGPGSGQLGRVTFKFRPHGVDLLCVPSAGDPDRRPPVGHEDHQVACLQVPQRLAHRRAAYPKSLAELILQEMSARRVDTFENGLLEPQDDFVGEARGRKRAKPWPPAMRADILGHRLVLPA